MATKRVHKNSFMYPDPLAKTVGSRTSRYRLLKKRSSTVRSSASLREDEVLEASAVSNDGVGDDETIAMCSEVGVIDSEVDSPPLTELDILSDFFCDELLLTERDTGRCTDKTRTKVVVLVKS